MDIEIAVTNSMELSRIHRAKYEKLVERFIAGLMDLPGVDCVVGPVFAETNKERKDRERLDIEMKSREKYRIKEALITVLKEPKTLEIIKNRMEKIFDSPEYQGKLARAVAGIGEE